VNGIDLLIVMVVALAAFTGYRQGLIAGVLGFVGFLGGAAIGMLLVPIAVQNWQSDLAKVAAIVIAVLSFAAVGQTIFAMAGAGIRDGIDWRPVRVADAAGGALLSAVAVLLVAWFLAIAVVGGPTTQLTRDVRNSAILTQIDGVMPEQGRTLFSALRNTFDQSLFPQVFAGIATPELVPVPAPDGDLATSPVGGRLRPSIVEVIGDSSSCNRGVTGSGFVISPGRVITNAHVVAGTDRLFIRAGGTGSPMLANVVLFDPSTDVAVLAVPELRAAPLRFASQPATRGDDAIVIGFPGGRSYTVGSARVRDVQTARGADIYDKRPVVRQIYSLRAIVRPGNSGGPMTDPQGRVLGMVFAASVEDPETGYALTNADIRDDAVAGVAASVPVPTGSCT
jgi:S1-C subfamily serine protease